MARAPSSLGINQTIMAALSMVTIAALIDAPGLGQTVLQALISLDVGTAFNAGLAIVDHGDHPRPGDHRGQRSAADVHRRAAGDPLLKYRRPPAHRRGAS